MKAKSLIPNFTRGNIPGYVAALAIAFGAGAVDAYKNFEGAEIVDKLLAGSKTKVDAMANTSEEEQAAKKKAMKSYNFKVDLLAGTTRSVFAILGGGVGNIAMKKKFFTVDLAALSIVAGFAASLAVTKHTAYKYTLT